MEHVTSISWSEVVEVIGGNKYEVVKAFLNGRSSSNFNSIITNHQKYGLMDYCNISYPKNIKKKITMEKKQRL